MLRVLNPFPLHGVCGHSGEASLLSGLRVIHKAWIVTNVPVHFSEHGCMESTAVALMEKLGLPKQKQRLFLAFMLKAMSKSRQARDVMSIPQTGDFWGITAILAAHAIFFSPAG